MAKSKKSGKVEQADAAAPALITSIKGFDADLSCRGFKFELGQSYSVEGSIKACSNGFHACPEDQHPLSVFEFYPPASSRYCIVEQSGDTDAQETKLASAKITIGVEISLSDLALRAVKWVFDRASWSTGAVATSPNEGATASGYQGAATASGDQGAATASGTQGAATASGAQGAATASGDQGAATASGDQGIACALGYESKARSGKSGAIVLTERRPPWDGGEILHIVAAKVGDDIGGTTIKPDTWYRLTDAGRVVEA